MYKNTRVTFMVIAIVALISIDCLAKSKIIHCSQEVFQAIEVNESFNFDGLRHKILVARKAVHSVSLNKEQRVQVEQSFQTGAKKLNCVSNLSSKVINSALYIPTVINGASLNDLKTSFWQFRLNVQDYRVGVWNQKSRLATQDFSEWSELKMHLQDQSVQLSLRKLTSKIAIIQYTRTKEQGIESVIVTYDVVESLK